MTAFRRQLFLHQDGAVLSFVIHACEERDILRSLFESGRSTVGELVASKAANAGPLHVALRCLAQQGWLTRHGEPGTAELEYRVTDIGREVAAAFPRYRSVASFARKHFPFAGLFTDEREGALAELTGLVELAKRGWALPASMNGDLATICSTHLEGCLAVALIVAMLSRSRLEVPELELVAAPPEVVAFFAHIGWVDGTGAWSEAGSSARAYALHYGMVGSYLPMLTQLSKMLFGAWSHRTHLAEGERETHVDRRLNVLGSGAAHERYFQDADSIFVDLFNRTPVSEQPLFLADMGCGDGSWLRHLFELVRAKTLRGQHLAAHPLLMIAADYNAQALEIARSTLESAGVPFRLLVADVGDPDGFAAKLSESGLDPTRGLHIRSFIDHNRTYAATPPSGTTERSDVSTGAYVDERGQLIPNVLLDDNLASFLSRWVPLARRHGLVILEAHCVEPRVCARHIGEIHSIAFDAYHGFSKQYPVDFEVFMRAARSAGLEAVPYHQLRYPTQKPFVSVSVNRFLASRDEDPLPRSAAPRSETGTWRPRGFEKQDGEALHSLLYADGDIRYPRNWCSKSTGILISQALEFLSKRLVEIRRGERPRSVTMMDYGTGSGLMALELLKTLRECGMLEQLESEKIRFEFHLFDIPSSWFAHAYGLLRECPHVFFHSVVDPHTGAFAELTSVLGVERPVDLAFASMVFHLVPPRALPRLAANLASVMNDGAALLWNSPDIGPRTAHSVLFHDPNRALRKAFLELLDEPRRLRELLDTLVADEALGYADLPDALERIASSLGPAERAKAEATANQQILPQANPIDRVTDAFEAAFTGQVVHRTFEMRLRDSLDALRVPSNQDRFLSEIADVGLRERIVFLLMAHRVVPELVDGPAGTGFGFNVLWTFGNLRRREARLDSSRPA